MTETQTETRGRGTSINPENLDEVLRASKNGGAGQSAFFTPLAFSKLCAVPLPKHRPVIVDLQAGAGNLLIGSANETTETGLLLDIENCKTHWQEKWPRPDTVRMAGDCTAIFPLLKEVSFEADCFALNPPFSLHWHKQNLAKLAESDLETVRQAFSENDSLSGADGIDSTAASLMMALDLCSSRGEGFLICNDASIERLVFAENAPYRMLAAHCWGRITLLGNPCTGEQKQTFDKEKDFFMGVVYFAASHYDGLDGDATFRADYLTRADKPADDRGVSYSFEGSVEGLRMSRHHCRSGAQVTADYHQCKSSVDTWKAVRTEWETRQGKRKADWNLWLDSEGRIQTYLSIFDNRSAKIPKDEAVSLFELNGKMVMELVMMRTSRQLLLKHVSAGIWRVEPNLPRQVDAAVKAYHAARAPLMPLNPVTSLGFCDEAEELECKLEIYSDQLIPR